MALQVTAHSSSKSAFCTFVYFASNRCNKIWMLLYYMVV
ncbi:unnamed protein product [Callosobruchus maculatus]|uniref:Uncharacterized protein n=1 Tax=Callosobruchus maculatus TaxID=64391 RepID=A0A653BZU8_CALMS|nr:unnamed protein product [Callosobruchus maculatus]